MATAAKKPAAKKAAPKPVQTFKVGDCVSIGGHEHTVDIIRVDECLVKSRNGVRKWVPVSELVAF